MARIARIKLTFGTVEDHAVMVPANDNLPFLRKPRGWTGRGPIERGGGIRRRISGLQCDLRFMHWNGSGRGFYPERHNGPDGGAFWNGHIQITAFARSKVWFDAEFVRTKFATEVQLTKVCKGITIFHRHADTALPGGESYMPRQKPHWTEYVPRQIPFGLRPTPAIDQPPKSVVPGVPRMIRFRKIKGIVM